MTTENEAPTKGPRTHQDIADAMEGLTSKHAELNRRERDAVHAEQDALRAECGAIGHIWGRSMFGTDLVCVVCGAYK